MNLSGRFFVKSNYIRAAKDDWIICDVRLLTDDTDTFLCIKSLPSSVLLSETTNCTDNEVSKFPEKSSYRPENFAARPFTALCNLSEYKSCSMRTEAVNSSASFALKLVPSSVFGNKKLLIATEDENEITAWLAICKTCIGKKSKNGSTTHRDLACNLGTLSKSGSFMSLKPNSQACESEFEDVLMDNEVYEAYSSEDKIPALLEEAGDWMKLHLCQPDCYLRLTTDRLEVLDFYSHKPVHWFPYLLIRRFGASNGVLRVDAGRRCSTGDGKFFFRCSPPNGQPVDALVTQIRQYALEAKQRTKRSQLSSSNLELHANNHNNNMTHNNINHMKGETLANTADNVLDSDHLDSSIHGTLPRARSKRTKVSSESTTVRSGSDCVNGGNDCGSTGNKTAECLPPKATPEPSDDVEANSVASNANDTEVFKATLCKAPKGSQELVNNSSNLYDNLPRPPRRGPRLPGAVNVLPLPARSHKQKDSSSPSKNEPLNSNETSTDTLDNLVKLNSKHIGLPSSLASLSFSATSPITMSPAVTPSASSLALTPSSIPSSPLPLSTSAAVGSSVFMNKKLMTPTTDPSHSLLKASNHLPEYSKSSVTSNTTSSSSSINFIDNSEMKSSELCPSRTPPSPIALTSTTQHGPTTTSSVVKSLIQSYTSISSSNPNYRLANANSDSDNPKNKSKPSSLLVPMTSSLSLKSPNSPISPSSASKSTTRLPLASTNECDNDNESRTNIHSNLTNKLLSSNGKIRVPSSVNSQLDTDHQQQKQQLGSNLSQFTNSKCSSASLYLSGPHPTNTTSNSSSTSCTISTCSPTINNITKPNPLPVKLDSVFRAEKTITRRPTETNNETNFTTNKTRMAKDDSRRYLSELDSVIKELCEANEAAVQATREAAQRRQRLGWSSSNSSQLKLPSTNESNSIPIPSSTNG
ncbi:Mucin-like protein [Schistosoma japonicum]|uniref:Mucin-like protein n=2 Tax=Schistosoma japonicum TaxID=6182 RepID=A0A4Z2CV41_SCHJA|nr:Mucin-like protein [Schistosoma japonicum]